MAQKSHLACSYAVLLLSDDGQAVTAASIANVLEKARLTTVEKYLPKLYASNITPAVIASTIANGGSSNSSPAPAAGSAAPAAAKEEKKAPGKI